MYIKTIKTWGTVDKQNIVTDKNTSKKYFNIKILKCILVIFTLLTIFCAGMMASKVVYTDKI